MFVRARHPEAAHEARHLFVVRVEDVWTVRLVDDAIHGLGAGVPADFGCRLEDLDTTAGIAELARARSARPSAPDDSNPHEICLIAAMTRSRSASLIPEPPGRQRPVRKISSLTPPPRTTFSPYTGCMCIGFQVGRASMSRASSSCRSSSADMPNASPSTVATVIQFVGFPNDASGMKPTPGTSRSACL